MRTSARLDDFVSGEPRIAHHQQVQAKGILELSHTYMTCIMHKADMMSQSLNYLK